MKKGFALMLALMLLVSGCIFALGEEETVQSDSAFENVLLKKGSLLIKEYEDAGSLETVDEDGKPFLKIYFQAAKLTDAVTGSTYSALRMKHDYAVPNYSGTSVGVIDSDEIDDVIATLQYAKENIGNYSVYTEMVYTANSGLVVGAYKRVNKDPVIFIKYSSRDTALMSFDSIDTVIAKLQEVQSKLN